MGTLLIAIAVGLAFILAYHTYGRWLGSRIFNLAADRVCPSHRLRDGHDYVPTKRGIVFGHHFTSIAATGPIVGPAIAVMWGWLPALLWVVLGSIFIGAVHDLGSLAVSLRNNGQTVGDIAGRVLNRRVRILFLCILFLALTIIIAIFGLVIAAVFRQYPATIFPVLVQIPIAIAIGLWLHRKGVNLVVPSILALAVMYLSVIFGDWGPLHTINEWFASWPTILWVAVLLAYCFLASVLPVWTLLQPRDYINSLQLMGTLALIVLGLVVAALFGGAPPVEGAERQPLTIAAPIVDWNPEGAPVLIPFLFITVACGAISGFHCLVSSGTSSKQLNTEADAQFVGYGSMLTEGFLATIVILACVAGLGLGLNVPPTHRPDRVTIGGEWVGKEYFLVAYFADETQYGLMTDTDTWYSEYWSANEVHSNSHFGFVTGTDGFDVAVTSQAAYQMRYRSWTEAGGLGRTVGAFVDGAGNFLRAMGIPLYIAVALVGVFVASFAATTLDTATRLQRYVIQELGRAISGRGSPTAGGGPRCKHCDYDLSYNATGACPECGTPIDGGTEAPHGHAGLRPGANPLAWLTNKYVATLVAVVTAGAMAALPAPGQAWSWETAGGGGMILWPMFGATNQLLAGLAFLVIAFWLWRRRKPVWFIALPLVFMLVIPAWAMLYQVFWANPGGAPGWLFSDTPNWPLIAIALATVTLEVWMIIEALLLFPKVRGVLEEAADTDTPAVALAEAEAGEVLAS